MSITDNDYKLLWGRAAGFCSRPGCRADLTVLVDGSQGYNVGEMAHIIAKSPSGPRGIEAGGGDRYDNLILLCPTCHSTIDKAPSGQFPVQMLQAWKSEHEAAIREAGQRTIFESPSALKQAVAPLLAENKALWDSLGPQSPAARKDPGSNLHRLWDLRKLDRIVPNNHRITNLVGANKRLLDKDELEAFIAFSIHAGAFEANQYGRLDDYPLFPERFATLFS